MAALSTAARPRLCFVTAVPLTLRAFFRTHIERLAPHYDIVLVASGTAADVSGLLLPHVTFESVAIERKISPARDLGSLVKLYRLFRAGQFDCVHSMTPKAGLLAMLAARAAGVPHRVHTFTGQVWATRTGWFRSFLRALDRQLASSATRLLADSESQRDFLVANGVAERAKIEVLGDGSVAGVDVDRFRPSPEARHTIRQALGIAADAIVFVFVGRLSRDKGIADLCAAFAAIAAEDLRLHVMVVGPDEEGLGRELAALGQRFPGRIHVLDYVDRPEDYLAASDVLLLPSYREGFGVVVIEAAAAGLPAIASRIYGVTDAVQDGVTGVLHAPAAAGEMAEAMRRLANDDAVRARLGLAARERALRLFSRDRVSAAFAGFYAQLLQPRS